jgi:hypothetical protein
MLQSRRSLLVPSDLEDFLIDGENLIFPPTTTLGALKDHLKSAQSWLNRLARSGMESGLARIEDLSKFIPEAEKISVDLSEQLESIYQTTKVYCLCRTAFHGFMVCCDVCEDWIHGPCVGLTKATADKSDKYSCLRCCIRASFAKAAESVGETINLWMNPHNVVRIAGDKKAKVVALQLLAAGCWLRAAFFVVTAVYIGLQYYVNDAVAALLL